MFARNRVHSSWKLWTTHLPDVNPHYAVKANPDRLLLKTLLSYGSGFDCASGRELQEVAALPLSNLQPCVVYANPCKPLRDLKTASSLGSPTTVVDSFEEVDKLASFGWQGSSLIRILVEDSGSLMPFSRKFGLPPSEVKALSSYAKSKALNLEGISFHVGSGCRNKDQYKLALDLAHSSLTILRKDGHTASTIDIGGGFLADEKAFETYSKTIRSALQPKTVRYIAEPGRFFAQTSFDFFVQVIGKKPGLGGNGWRYTIDDSLYGQFSCIPFDQQKPIWVRIPTSSQDKMIRKATPGTLFGRTCDSLDMIASSPSMEELHVGDWLWFPNMGAYTSVTASEFNGFPKPPVLDLDVELPSLNELVPAGLRDRVPFDVATVNGVTVQCSTIPSVA